MSAVINRLTATLNGHADGRVKVNKSEDIRSFAAVDYSTTTSADRKARDDRRDQEIAVARAQVIKGATDAFDRTVEKHLAEARDLVGYGKVWTRPHLKHVQMSVNVEITWFDPTILE